MPQTFTPSVLRTAAICGYLLVPFSMVAQEAGLLKVRMNTERSEGLPGTISDAKAMGSDRVLILARDFGNASRNASDHLCVYDRATLHPMICKEVKPTGPSKNAALEELIEHRGEYHLLVSFQDLAGKTVSLNLMRIDPATLELGPAVEIFKEPEVALRGDGLLLQDHGVLPLGFTSEKNTSTGGLRITRLDGDDTADEKDGKCRITVSWVELDKALQPFSSNRHTTEMPGLSEGWCRAYPSLSNDRMVYLTPRCATGSDKDEVFMHAHSIDATGVDAVGQISFSAEFEPYSLTAVVRPDGKVVCGGIYGERRGDSWSGAEKTVGAYLTLFDPAKNTWMPVAFVPINDKKGKPARDLKTISMIAGADNGVLIGAHAGEWTAELSYTDVALLCFDSGGQPTGQRIMPSATSTHGLGMFDILGQPFLALNDNPTNAAKRAAGETKLARSGFVPCYAALDMQGNFKEYYFLPKDNGFNYLRAAGLRRVDERTWAASCTMKYSVSGVSYGLVLLEAGQE